MKVQARHGENRQRCAIEELEDRRLFSAATVLAALRPLAAWPTYVHHVGHGLGVHATPRVGSLAPVVNAGPNIIGLWTGTFTRNSDRLTVPGGVTFASQHNSSFTGVFDVASVAGQNVLSTVTVIKSRAFPVMLKLAGKGQMSLAGVVTSDLSMIIGRWSVQKASGWTTGIFAFTRQVPASAPAPAGQL